MTPQDQQHQIEQLSQRVAALERCLYAIAGVLAAEPGPNGIGLEGPAVIVAVAPTQHRESRR